MTTCVDGLVKIGKTQNYDTRMRHLERNGYMQINGLRRCLAIEVNDYDSKETLLKNVFAHCQIGKTELFAANIDLIKQLLLSMDGKVIYPSNVNKQESLNNYIERTYVKEGIVPRGEYRLSKKNSLLKKTIKATMIIEPEKIILKSGSIVSPYNKITVPGWSECHDNLKTDGKNILLYDVECSSFSMASSIAVGHNSNGWNDWKTLDGQPIDTYRPKEESED